MNSTNSSENNTESIKNFHFICSFYNNSSSFLHEGLDANNRDAQIVVGQKQIHNKIVQLNFLDCHAKISQVDAQATLGNGVVVQVTGELSNAGQPMRRFTQTFVLAAQSPKKYYVHNDIFRYQDYYTDEEVEENGRSDAEEEPVVDSSSGLESQQPGGTTTGSQTIYYQSNFMASSAPSNTYQQQVGVMNGLHSTVSIDESVVPTPAKSLTLSSEPGSVVDNEVELKVLDTEENVKNLDMTESYEDEHQDTHNLSNEPKTYANLVKSGGQGIVPSISPPPSIPSKFNQVEINRFSNDPPLGATTQKPLAQRPLRGT